jgi:hypothetical protein
MPVEIREIVIKTEISSAQNQNSGIKPKDLQNLKLQLLEECKKMIHNQKKQIYQR